MRSLPDLGVEPAEEPPQPASFLDQVVRPLGPARRPVLLAVLLVVPDALEEREQVGHLVAEVGAGREAKAIPDPLLERRAQAGGTLADGVRFGLAHLPVRPGHDEAG
jgi:hypothetical protein